MRRLAAIAAILGAAAGLDAEQPAELDAVGIEVRAMHGVRPEQQVVERCLVKRAGRLGRPPPRGARAGGGHAVLLLIHGHVVSLAQPSLPGHHHKPVVGSSPDSRAAFSFRVQRAHVVFDLDLLEVAQPERGGLDPHLCRQLAQAHRLEAAAVDEPQPDAADGGGGTRPARPGTAAHGIPSAAASGRP